MSASSVNLYLVIKVTALATKQWTSIVVIYYGCSTWNSLTIAQAGKTRNNSNYGIAEDVPQINELVIML